MSKGISAAARKSEAAANPEEARHSRGLAILPIGDTVPIVIGTGITTEERTWNTRSR